MPRATAPRRRLVLLLVACLAAAFGGLFTSTASAAPNSPAAIVIDSITADTTSPGGANPYVLVKAGDSFTVHVSFYDSEGNPASFNNDTTLAISSNRGALTPSTGVALRNATSADLVTSLSSAANQVSITVKVAGGRLARVTLPGTSSSDQLFDVVSQLRLEDSTTNFQQGIGGDSNCTTATKTAPVCGIVILPNGATSSQVLLSLGACDTTAYTKCGSTKGSVIQTLFAGVYSNPTPAILLLKCDKSLCGGGAIQNVHANFTLTGNGALEQAPRCPAKNTVGPGQTACVDYVQSKRDGSGDTHLYLLFLQDLRGGIS